MLQMFIAKLYKNIHVHNRLFYFISVKLFYSICCTPYSISSRM